MKTFLNLRLEERFFVTIIIFSCSPPWKSDLKLKNFVFNLLLTFDLTAVGKFWSHIWNRHILLVIIEEHFWSSSTHPTTHPRREQVYSYWKTYSKCSKLWIKASRRALSSFFEVTFFGSFCGGNWNFHNVLIFGCLRSYFLKSSNFKFVKNT